MIRSIDLRGAGALSTDVLPRRPAGAADVDDAIRGIIDEVAERGEAAVLDLCQRLDGVRPRSLRVPPDVIRGAAAGLDPALEGSLREMIERLRAGHSAQIPVAAQVEIAPGATVTQRWEPVGRVGFYVPGGRAAYPSSVVMNAVPAQIAGVQSIAVVSPPQRSEGGWPSATVLAAASILGIDEVYAVGGAQAIAMLAFGTLGAASACIPVDLVTGPGNAYVAGAKRMLSGRIGIDAEAGPTEIMVLADSSADPMCVAADMISQAEHDSAAAAVLVTDSERLAGLVRDELERQARSAVHRDRIETALGGQQSAIVLVADIDQAVTVANGFAPEHVEVLTTDAQAVADRLRNAGAIFVGPFSPVPLGDYLAGSNHVLPTAGAARHTGGLSVMTFLRSVQLIEYSRSALAGTATQLGTIADAEGLPAHKTAVRVRLGLA